MTPFPLSVRQQVKCALLLAVCLLLHPIKAAVLADSLLPAIAAAKSAKPAPLFPRSVMTGERRLRQVRLSPDGSKIAYSLNQQRRNELWLYDVETNTHNRMFASKALSDIAWSMDSGHIFLLANGSLAAVSTGASDAPALLAKLEKGKYERFLGVDPTQPHAALVSKASADGTGHLIQRILPDGTRRLLHRTRHHLVTFLPTAEGGGPHFVLRVNGTMLELVRISGEHEHSVLKCSATDRCALLAYQAASGRLIMRGSFGQDKVGLYGVDPETGATSLIHSDPEDTFDLAWAILDPLTGTPHAAGYRTGHTRYHGLTADAASAIARISARHPGRYLTLYASTDLSRWLVFDGNSHLPKIEIFDTVIGTFSTPFADLLHPPKARHTATIEDHLAPRVPIWYRVSDGMRQLGYVTLPLGADPATMPLVVMPHGGPWGRTDGSFNKRAQFLANRGYAVFEPNFRASTGFGKHYSLSADRDFGDGRVQQDIIDGVDALLARGVGEPKKLAVIGHSFGGFSVLAALSFTPDRFKLGIASAPPVDLAKTVRFFAASYKAADRDIRLSNYRRLAVDIDDPADVARIERLSPDRHWTNITKPLYIWAGKQDPKVSVLNVRDYALRHAQAGKAITYIEEPEAGHSPRKPVEREAYYYLLEKALSDHLGGRMETGMSHALQQHLSGAILLDANNLSSAVRP